ncbi:DUF4296 domain-containing protein [Pedobacter africanus]|uniref:DUF4296 domain-containing protein n=1 Tax=Pedobacter africanus TaxID=151894 RepID=A0A1W1YYR4_9SPHI|nr:DUF4296 domain-containing protein [Pedobacter africanus]SMC41355.1 protein of unknown function [Pedobacter africanus]
MKNFLCIAMVFFFASGCKPGIPKDIIQPEEMAKVLQDIHIADGYVTNTPHPDSIKVLAASYYKGIYKKYNIDSALYAKSMEYYNTDPKALNDIYLKVTAELTKEKNSILKADSLFNAGEIAKARLKLVRDSARKADSAYWRELILKPVAKPKDTAAKDTVKKKIDVIRLKMDYKGLNDLK